MPAPPVKSREISAATAVRQSATRLVAPFQERIGELQTNVAKLRAMAQLGRNLEAVRAEAMKILPLVVALRIEIEAAIADASPDIAGHSRVADQRKALIKLREDTDALLEATANKTPAVR